MLSATFKKLTEGERLAVDIGTAVDSGTAGEMAFG